MKIVDLLIEEQATEAIGQTIAKGVGGLAKGVGAVGGGVAGAWDAMKQGFEAGKAAVTGQPMPSNAATGSKQTSAAQTAPAQQQAPTAQASATELDQLKATLAKLDPQQKKDLATELEKSMNAATQTTTPAATAQPKAAPAASAGSAPLTPQQVAAKKAELQGKRAAGKSMATSTGTGFQNYKQSQPGQVYAGADEKGNPIFKPAVSRESKEIFSRFLNMKI